MVENTHLRKGIPSQSVYTASFRPPLPQARTVCATFVAHLGPARPCRGPRARRLTPWRARGSRSGRADVELLQHGVDMLDGLVEVRSQLAARQHHLDAGGRWCRGVFWLCGCGGMGLGTGHTYTGNAVLCWAAAVQRLLYSRPLRALPDAKISRLMSGCACMVVWGHHSLGPCLCRG